MEKEDVDAILKHYGVLGMKWGVRRSPKQLAKAKTSYKKSAARLSDQELQKRIQRMETEKRYNDLNKKSVSTGQKLAVEIVTTVGKSTVQTVATGLALYAIRQGVEKKFGSEAASWIPKKKK